MEFNFLNGILVGNVNNDVLIQCFFCNFFSINIVEFYNSIDISSVFLFLPNYAERVLAKHCCRTSFSIFKFVCNTMVLSKIIFCRV